MAEQSVYSPKQLMPFSGELLDELQGRVSIDAATDVLLMLPALKSTSKIHDNACGTGAVTEAIVAKAPPQGLQIEGTDVFPMFLDTYKQRIKAYKWPASAAAIDMSTLEGIPDNHFSHSITNFALMAVPDDVAAAKQIYRTLKPGGVAAVTIWSDQPHISALKVANKVTRGQDAPDQPMLTMEWYKGENVKQALIKAGFDESKIRQTQITEYMEIKDAKRWCTLAWSFLGAGVGGWQAKDEESWDEAIATVQKELTRPERWTATGDGAGKVKMIADVVTAAK